MPLPLILGIGAAVAGVAGVGTGIHGAVKMKEANDTMTEAKTRHERNIKKFEKQNKSTTASMDSLGKLELDILHTFGEFSDVFEKIQNRPVFAEYHKDGVKLPTYDGEKIKEVSVGAGVLLGGLGGAGAGAAGGFAAAGATTAAVMALGTASTGTAIASLSGVAATNATLAALGGGAIAAGGGGMALGTTILGATTLGVGLLVGGIIFNFAGGKLSDKADEAMAQAMKAQKQINKICSYLKDLRALSDNYQKSLQSVNELYTMHLTELKRIVNVWGHTDWNDFTDEEKRITENTVLLVGLLYNMCKVELVKKSTEKNGINTINQVDAQKAMEDATRVTNNITNKNIA